MVLKSLSKLISPQFMRANKARKCHSMFHLKELLQPERADQFTVHPVTSSERQTAVDVIKRYYLPEHVFVRARNMDLNDCALDEYLVNLLKQGNTLYARAEDGSVAGVCVNFASSPVDPKNLRLFAYYRQDPNVKDFLCFAAKLQETPNLWEAFDLKKVFEVKMLTVLPEYRRQGLAASLVERSKQHALDQGYKVVRMDCINPYDYKVAERCMLQCIAKFPLHKLRGPHAPFVKRSETSRQVRVYVGPHANLDAPECDIKARRQDLESLIE